MLKLFKYEMRKTLFVKLILLILAAATEGLMFYGVQCSKVGTATLGFIFFVIVALVGTLFIGVTSVTTLHRDMNTKQSYMLFMTPNSNYSILGAKALEFMLSLLIAVAAFFGLAVANFNMLIGKFPDAQELTDFLTQMKEAMNINVDISVATVGAVVIETAAEWFETIMLAFLADVMATSVMKGKKFGLLLTFVIFAVLFAVSNKLVSFIPDVNGFVAGELIRAAALLVISGVVYVATSVLMEKKLSV